MELVATTCRPQLRPFRPQRSAMVMRRCTLMVTPAASSLHRRAAAVLPAAAACAAQGSPAPAAPHPLAAAALGCMAALLLAVAPPSAEAKDVIQGVPKVVDGDTLDFSGTRVRLFGIDAPETKQSCKAKQGAEYMCGERSKEALLQKIGNGKVECEQKNRDKYGRVVGRCSLNGEDLNGWLVEQGLAVAYRQYSKDYVPLEDAARAAGRGIWAGTFEVPAEWRKDHPRGGVTTVANAAPERPPPPPGCPIKGNINAKGEKIYHVPGGAVYERTVIEPEKGERYFCTTAEAEAAGWRASGK